MGGLRVGTQVVLDHDAVCTVKFVGRTMFGGGKWVGLALPVPAGTHNGTVDNVVYFRTKANHGVFVRPSRLTPVEDLASPPPSSLLSRSPFSRTTTRTPPSWVVGVSSPLVPPPSGAV